MDDIIYIEIFLFDTKKICSQFDTQSSNISYMSNLKIFVPNMKLLLDLSGLTVN